MKYFQNQQYRHQNDIDDVVLVFLLLTLTKELWVKHDYHNNVQKNFHGYYFCVFIVDFEKFFLVKYL